MIPRGAVIPSGTYRLAVTKVSGRDSKITFSMRKPSSGTISTTRALRGVSIGGSPPNPSMKAVRSCSLRASTWDTLCKASRVASPAVSAASARA